MPPATRLDPVIRLRERAEGTAQLALAQQIRAVQSAASALGAASSRAAEDRRAAGDAGSWQLAETLHYRALVDLKSAQLTLETARAREDAARAACALAQQRTEMVVRARARKHGELSQHEAKAERRQMDEIALLLRAG